MKRFVKRSMAAILVVVMLLSAAPLNGFVGLFDMFDFSVEASAASTSYKVNGVTVPIGKYVNNGPCFLDDTGSRNCWAFAQYVYKKLWDGKTFSSSRGTSDDMLRKIPSGDGRNITAANAKKYISFAQPGATIRMANYIDGNDGFKTKNGKGDRLHSVILVAKDEKGCVIYDSNATVNKKKVTRLRYYTWAQFESNFKALKYFKYIKWPGAPAFSDNIKVTLTSDKKDVTNTSGKIKADFNASFSLQGAYYILSTNKADVNVDATKENNRKKTSTRDFVTVKGAHTAKSVKANVLTYQGAKLQPNKTYYYKVLVKVSGKWYQSSVSYFTTANNLPATPELTFVTGKTDYSVSDAVAVSWKSADNADSYNVTVYDASSKAIFTKSGITSNTFSFEPNAKELPAAGEYYFSVTAVNAVGKKESAKKKFTLHEDKTVEFYDTVNNQVIKTEKVPYGETAIAPENIEQNGYTFIKWDKEYTCITEDIRVSTVYEAKEYSVKFVDGLTGKVLDTQTVRYNEAAIAPKVSSITGYDFVGWNKDFSSIKEDTTITSNYKWYSENYPVVSEIVSVTRNENKDGYDVVVKVESGVDETIQGRLVMTLKTESGYQITESESAAFSIQGKGVKEVATFVPSASLAYEIEVFSINDFEKLGIIAKPVSKLIDNSSAWSEWISYDADVPVKEGVNGVSAVETKTETTEDVVLYRYRDKSTTTSYETSLAGWTQNGGTWVKSGTGSIVYAKGWPDGFDKSHSLYSKYNKTPKSATETTTTKTEVSDKPTGYIYWHWCRGRTLSAPDNSLISNKEGDHNGELDTFHAFYSTEEKKAQSTKYTPCFKWSYSKYCKDSYWWYYDKSLGGNGAVQIYTQTYTTYKKLFNYYKWSAWSEWSETPISQTDTREVETVVIPGETVKYYRYKTSEAIAKVDVTDAQIKDIEIKVNESFADKEAVVTVYKYLRASDYTIEFIDNTVVGKDGTIVLDNIALREALTVETGDYKITVSIEGNSEAIEVDVLDAPKPIYNVKFYDFNGTDIIYEVNVEAGGTVVVPEEYMDKLNVPEGYRFTNWNQSTVNVNSDLSVMPLNEKNKYVVVFVDWASQEVVLQELEYGAEIIPPIATTQKGKNVSWDMSNALKVTDGEEEKYIVVENTVVSTVYTDIVYNSTFVSPDSELALKENAGASDEETTDIIITEEDIILESNNTFDEYIETPMEVEEAEEYIFRGWKNVMTGEYLTDMRPQNDAVYVPMYEFAETVEDPVADIVTGEYTEAQTVTLTSATESAVIYYTLDGTDPQTSETAIMYTEPITISSSVVLNYCAMAVNMNNSSTLMELYAINTGSVTPYHIVSVYTDLPYMEGVVYQSLVKDFVRFDATPLQDFEGYTFSGLYYDEDLTEVFDTQNEPVIESMDVYAHYVPLQYNVTFLDEDGTVLSTQSVEYGTAVEEPEAPTKEGYVFIGWDSDGYECVTEDGTYTARYIPESEYAYVSIKGRAVRPVYVDAEVKLSIEITPDELSEEPVSWTSSDPSIATVDYMGNVTLVGVGTVYITVTVDSNGESDTVEFRVNEDNTVKVVLGPQSYMMYDTSGYLRGLKVAVNTVEEVRSHFTNDELHFFNPEGTELSDTDKVGTDTVVRLMDGDAVLDEKTFIMTGDVNGDGWYDGQDSTIVACLAEGMLTSDDVSESVYIAADCNYDGVIDQKDVELLNKAGALISNVDQNQPVEDLEEDENFVAYASLIDQTADIEIEIDDTDEIPAEPDEEINTDPENGENTDEDTTQQEDDMNNSFEWLFLSILEFFKSVFSFLMSLIFG